MDSTVIEGDFIEEMVQEVEEEINHPANDGKVCVVVEGEDDISLYGKFLNESLMFFYTTGDCIYVVPIIKSLSQYENQLIAIKDADFDHLRGITYSEKNLFLTDTHDSETMILKTGNVSDIVYEYTHKRMPNIVSDVFGALEWYSYLQYYNTTEFLSINKDGIKFKGLKMGHLFDGSSPIDCNHCLETVKKFANNAALPHFPTIVELQSYRTQNETTDVFNLHRGHDAIHCMAIIIRNNTYPKGPKIGDDQLPKQLRILYQITDFQQTNLYQSLDAWMLSTGHPLWN